MQKNVLRKLFTSHKRDLLLGAGLLLLALGLFFVVKNCYIPQGGTVSVKSCGRLIGTYPLNQDQEIEIKAFLQGSNTLVIEHGEAYVKNASCANHQCEKMGHISKVGEMIICLPNELFITVTAGEEGDVDAIVE